MLVEIWSDVVCPWCAIGKVRFERALDQFEHADEVEVVWRSFELDTKRAATTDVDYVAMLAQKYGTSKDEAQAMIDRMTQSGADEGIEFNFDIARPGNTFDSHRLIHLGAAHGLQHEVKQRMLDGYHTEGVPIADHGALTTLAVEAGLDEIEVKDTLTSDRYAADVRADEQQAYDYGISGVPFFVLDKQAGVSGAQPTEHLLEALRQVHAGAVDADQGQPATSHDHPAGETCTDDACAI